MTDPTRTGWKTSEFWTTIGSAALAFAAALSSAMGWAFDATKYQTAIPIVATVMAGLVGLTYNHGRAKLKTTLAAVAPAPAVLSLASPLLPSAAETTTLVFPPSPTPPAAPPADALPDDVPPPTVGTLA